MKTTARSLIECRRRGWECDLVERNMPSGGNMMIRTRRDLLNCIDIIALDGCVGSLGIQACGRDLGTHKDKINTPEVLPRLLRWLAAGNRFELWGWRPLKVKRGGKAVRWTLTRHRAFVGASGGIGWEIVEEPTA